MHIVYVYYNERVLLQYTYIFLFIFRMNSKGEFTILTISYQLIELYSIIKTWVTLIFEYKSINK